MKTTLLSYFALISLLAAVVGVAFGLELALFAIAVSAMVLLIAVTDYAPRRCYHRVMCGAASEPLPFAA